jgi:hypothetical protein
MKPQVHEVLVCNSRRNALLKEGSKNDRIDARKLSELLHAGMLRPVYHGEHGLRTLRELGRTYQTLSKDLNRLMNRVKALYRGWGIACGGTQVYAPRYREEWLQKIEHAGVRRRAELLYEQLDGLQALRRKVRPELIVRCHSGRVLVHPVPCCDGILGYLKRRKSDSKPKKSTGKETSHRSDTVGSSGRWDCEDRKSSQTTGES